MQNPKNCMLILMVHPCISHTINATKLKKKIKNQSLEGEVRLKILKFKLLRYYNILL